jgi:hypothetical protein
VYEREVNKKYLHVSIGDGRVVCMHPVVFTDLEDVEMPREDEIFDHDSLHLDVVYVLVGCMLAYVMSSK